MSRSSPRDHWDRLAPRYDDASAWVERRFLARGRAWVCARAHGRVLEVGVGTGASLSYYGPDVRLVGIDTSEGMLEQARAKVRGMPSAAGGQGPAGGRAQASGPVVEGLRMADAGALPYDDGVFDCVVATYVLCCVPDLRLALTEAVRVLAPGGDLLLADHVVSTAWPVRLAQRALEVVTVRSADEHFTRRPLDVVRELDVELVATTRHTLGALETVHARTPGEPGRPQGGRSGCSR